MIIYKDMNAKELEAQYNLIEPRGMDNIDALKLDWINRSAKFRETSGALEDIAYGDGEREKLDYFYSGNPKGPLLLYIHGGYWQLGDKNMYSFITEAFVKNGISVAVLNYNLIPSVRMGQMPPQIRKAIAWCFYHANELKFAKDKLHLSGHSAGGHLGAMTMTTDWRSFDKQLPQDLIRSATLISGVYDLEGVVKTSLNNGLQMDLPEALKESPLFIPLASNAPQLIAYGSEETKEFHNQSIDYADKFRTPERAIECYEIPNADHFDELEQLTKEDTVLFEKVYRLINS